MRYRLTIADDFTFEIRLFDILVQAFFEVPVKPLILIIVERQTYIHLSTRNKQTHLKYERYIIAMSLVSFVKSSL